MLARDYYYYYDDDDPLSVETCSILKKANNVFIMVGRVITVNNTTRNF